MLFYIYKKRKTDCLMADLNYYFAHASKKNTTKSIRSYYSCNGGCNHYWKVYWFRLRFR